jgi:anaerobic magnesium-protoporphyrin IX monomethyl ester cyclase
MRIILLEHPRLQSEEHFNDIANTPLWSCLMTGYAASSLQAAGQDAFIVDAAQLSFKNTVRKIMEKSPDLLAVHAVYFWEHTEKLFHMLTDLREQGYSGIICLYGFFPTLAWEDILAQAKAVDCVVVGEPEETLVDLTGVIATAGVAKPAPGLAARLEGKPIFPGFRKPLIPLDKLPFPARPWIKHEETTSILASRGCYNGCSFCLIPTLDGNKAVWRKRSIVNVAEEIRLMKEFGKTDFYFVDPNFIGPGQAGQEHAKALAAAISEFGITFGLETRASDINKSLVQILHNAGLTSLLLGIESGSSRVLQRLHKRTTVADNERAIAHIREVGIEPEIGFIMFDPESTIEDIQDNLDFLDRNHLLDRLDRTANLLYHDQIAFKGTLGYRIALTQERLKPYGLWGFEGEKIYADYRTGWLASHMRILSKHILKEMSRSDSRISWRQIEAGENLFPEINEVLVQNFKKGLYQATQLQRPPKTSWSDKQRAVALDEIDACLKHLQL